MKCKVFLTAAFLSLSLALAAQVSLESHSPGDSLVATQQSLRNIMLSPAFETKKVTGPMRPKTFHPAFFCRLEDKIARDNPVMFKFRLGEVDYVDYLESKPHSPKIYRKD